MATYPDTKILPTAQLLLNCLTDAALDNPKPPKIVGFRTGTDGLPLGSGGTGDECCMGAAFIRIVRTFPSWGAPTPSSLSVSCAQPMAVEFEMSMWRCAPIGAMNSLVPQAAWDELNTDLLNDRATILAAVCRFIGLREQKSVMYGDWQPVPSDGGCAGGTMTVMADLFKRY